MDNFNFPAPANKLIIQHKKGKRYDGSLLRLFQSEYFNIHMLFGYLLKKNELGVIDYLVNELYSESLDDLDFYLPQLCYLVLTKEITFSLQKFILETSRQQPNFGMKALLNFLSYSQDKTQLKEKAADMYGEIEQTLINLELPPKYGARPFTDKTMTAFYEKKYREEYFTYTINFWDRLKVIALALK